MTHPENSSDWLTGKANRDIAIIGMACHFPGASDYTQFWRNLANGVNSIQEIPFTRWDQAKYYSPAGGEGKSHSKWCGLVENIDQFDARFFHISPREACEMDPQQRLVLEETLHCIEDAGIALEELQNHRTGVFVGYCGSDYQQISATDEIKKDSYAVLGNFKSILSNRISYFLNLTGPSISIDGACASSLVAVHEAVKALQSGDCEYAIVGGVNVNVHPWKYVVFSQANMLSREGQCRTFDRSANGYVPGDGVGVVLLQRSQDAALRRNRTIGTIKASAVNHNGKTVSITAPSVDAQRELISTVYEKCGISPRTVTYVEAHGTGTSLGDPIEVEALHQAFRAHTEEKGFCHIGSVKSNIGHLEGAAGMAGLLKVLLMMRNRWIPKTLHITTLNPIIDFANTAFVPAVNACEWRQISAEIPLRASISAFGFGGVNAHVLVEDAPQVSESDDESGAPEQDAYPRLFTLSARSADSLRWLVERWKAFAGTREFERIPLRDLCGTLLNSRSRFEYRFGFAIQEQRDIQQRLNEFAGASQVKLERWNLRLGEFAITGYGAVRRVLDESAALRNELDAILDEAGGNSIRAAFQEERWTEERRAANELLFGYAYVSLLMKLGFRPAMVSSIGRGVYLACAVSGMASIASMTEALFSGDLDAVSLDWPKIAVFDGTRHEVIQGFEVTAEYLRTLRNGIAVLPEEVDSYRRQSKLLLGHQGTFARYFDEWVAAAEKGGVHLRTVLDGQAACSQEESICFVVAAGNTLHRLKTKWQLTERVELASPASRELLALVNDGILTREQCVQLLGGPQVSYPPIVESMRRAIDGVALGETYPMLREMNRKARPVQNPADWLRRSAENGLAGAGAMNVLRFGSGSADGDVSAAAFVLDAPGEQRFDEALLKLWLAGVTVRWEALMDPASYGKAALPLYAFDRQRYWLEKKDAETAPAAIHPLVQRATSGAQPHFTSTFSGDEFFLRDHKVEGARVLPGVAYLEMVRKAWEMATGDSTGTPAFASVAWIQPIQVAEKAETVHVRLTPNGTGSFGYEVYSDSALHGQGTVRAGTLESVPKIDIPELQRGARLRCAGSAEFYEQFRAIGIDYGPGHQGVREVCGGGDYAVASIVLPSSAAGTAGDFVLHPSMMDSALQAGVWMLDARRPMLPFAVESIEVFARTRTHMWAVARFADERQAGELRSLNVDLCDESGSVCVRLKGLSIRSVRGNRAAAQGPATMQPTWTRFDPVPRDSPAIGRDARVLVFGADRHRGAMERAFPNSIFWDGTAGPPCEGGSIDQVVWFAAEAAPAAVSDDVIEQQRGGVLQFFRLIKALLHEGYGTREMVWTVCTAEALRVEASDRVDPTHAGIHGLAGCMAKEFPSWHVRLLDLERGGELPGDLFRIAGDAAGNPIAYRRGKWLRREFVPVGNVSAGKELFRRGGTYVVIGGAGGIGTEWSRWLIERYQAQLIWIGRREKTEAIQRQIDELGTCGPAPYYIRADATNLEQLRAAHAEIRGRFAPIHGVVHSAIVLKDGSLAKMTEEQFTASLEANVDVCVRMAQVFRPEELDFVLFFSSVLSFCTFAGQSNYAAGCTFKDAFAMRLRQEWPCAVKVVNWGYWGSVGVVANEFYRESMAMKGFGSIEPAEGFEALHGLMSGPVDQAAIVKTLGSGAIDGWRESQPKAAPGDAMPSYMAGVRKRLAAVSTGDVAVPSEAGLESLLSEILWATLQSLGLFRSGRTRASDVGEALRWSREHTRWMEETVRQLVAAGFLVPDGEFVVPGRAALDLEGLWSRWDEVMRSRSTAASPQTRFHLAEACLRGLPAVLRREMPATGVLFPSGSTRLVESFFKDNPVADFCNDMVGRAVVAFLEERLQRGETAKIRLLEIGGGTGATTAAMLRHLAPYERHIETYCFSDISKAFLLQANRDLAPRARYLKTALFNVEKPIEGQEAGGQSYDVVLATNVLHATRSIRNTLRNAKAALKKNGLLVLNELSRNTLFIHLTFGLLDGWWLYEDEALRIPGSPILTSESWAEALRAEGFGEVLFPLRAAAQFGQQIVLAERDGAMEGQRKADGADECPTDNGFRDRCLEFLRKEIATCLKMQAHEIDATRDFEEYGVDSLLVIQLTNTLRQYFADIGSTLFFEVQNLNGLVDRLMQTHGASLAEQVGGQPEKPAARLERGDAAAPLYRTEDVAIIGLSGRYPGAADVDEFWQRLRAGECCVTEVPAERWDWREYYDERKGTAGRSCTRWGGFLKGVDEFDPLFFRIAPREAEKMDPQERLFLETAHASIEDAGYTPGSLSASSRVGVFVGVMNSTYGPNPRYWSIANRVSHCFDFRGPSLAVDTACSSSLTAIHLAIESLCSGTSECAVAGGVNLILHPLHMVGLSEMTMLSAGKECRSFGDQADGFVDAEGVGALVLKPARQAMADGDHIYAIIKASLVNAAGKSSGYTKPNLNMQRDLIAEAIERAKVDPSRVSYVEAHGTGTALGDPIEISALTQAFEKARRQGDAEARCAIGSVKSNIGHAESAAGIAGLTKILLQMKHGELVPSLHAEALNPQIGFARTPFTVQQHLEPWKRVNGLPRMAGISSFGAGGSNAHLIVEEYRETRDGVPAAEGKPALIVLSALNEERLNEAVRRLCVFLEAGPAPDLQSIAYTLQVGREPMKERLGLVATSAAELTERLGRYLENPSAAGDVLRGSGGLDGETSALFDDAGAMAELARSWMRQGRYAKVLGLWTKGFDIDWNGLYGDRRPPRISLPTYPFARERYWVSPKQTLPHGARRLHPLLHEEVSTANGEPIGTAKVGERFDFRSVFTGEEAFIADHKINGRMVLSAAACLELVRAAVAQTGLHADQGVLQIGPCTWMKPIVSAGGHEVVSVRLVRQSQDAIAFELFVQAAEDLYGDSAVLSAEGMARINQRQEVPSLDVGRLRAACQPLDPAWCYENWRSLGVEHGPSYRGIEEVFAGPGQVLARIALPGGDGFVLNPGTLDSAFQASIALFAEPAGTRPYLPFAMESLEIFESCPTRVWAWIRRRESQASERDVAILDLDLCREEGKVCLSIRGLACRKPELGVKSETRSETRISRPVWKEAAADAGEPWTGQRQIVVCEREEFDETRSCLAIRSGSDRAEVRFQQCAVRLLEVTRTILSGKPSKPVLIQVVIPPRGEEDLLGGLAGILLTAALENPLIRGQVIEIGREDSGEAVLTKLRECSRKPEEAYIRYADGGRWVHSIEEVDGGWDASNLPWKDDGVYLITGGAGGLGLIFAREIARHTGNATLILVGRSSLSEEQQAGMKALGQLGATVEYRRTDVSKKEDVDRMVGYIVDTYGRLNGIIHAAGVVRDNFILKKTEDELRQVFAAKADGALNLDDATQSLKLDLFVLFSSIAAFGNAGQADYAAANGFLDEFAGYRNGCVRDGLRSGHTLSINWPLWSEGGMTIDETGQRVIRELSGRIALSTERGIAAFYRALAVGGSQVLVEEFEAGRRVTSRPERLESRAASRIAGPADDKVVQYFKRLLASVLKLPVSRIQTNVALDEYGLDSIMVTQLNRDLERDFGPISKTLFFEYPTIAKVAEFFVEAHEERLRTILQTPIRLMPAPIPQPTQPKQVAETSDVAIVGVSGRYPGARDVNAYWENLKAGIDCITEVPRDRWDWREYYSENPKERAGHNSKWGGFIEDVDRFDALFFNISPREAETMDPQERLILEHVWMAFEDAGYRREVLPEAGVYVGVMYGEYQLLGAEASLNGQRMGFAGTLASIANRVSYVFDLHGPSMTVDTMCSSSLTTLHLACQDLKSGRIDVGIAGGVNVIIHPNKYLMLSGMRFLSDRGRCESFGEGGDGYVPGEGVGVVVLKRLADAERNGDHIYGVIKGSALNHGGRTNGYTVPNPAAQQEVIRRALQEARIDPRTVSYVEAHGTGTKLGDPIEIAGLTKAFTNGTGRGPVCWIGSAKSNIGHCESAAGVAGLTKVLLQMQHRQIVPSLHSRVLNSAIDFSMTTFSVTQELQTWKRPSIDGVEHPRRAGISSFGAGGANAHVIVEEYEDRRSRRSGGEELARDEFLIVLSAKNADRLREVAHQLHGFLSREATPGRIELGDVAMTLQVGREAMEERLGFIVASMAELLQKLEAFLDGRENEGEWYRGRVERNEETLAEFSSDEDMAEMVAAWIAKGKYGPLLRLWVKGLAIDWSRLYKGEQARRISLPTYPFARERHWIEVARRPATGAQRDEEEDRDGLTYLPAWREASGVDAKGYGPQRRVLVVLPEPASPFVAAIRRHCRDAVTIQLGSETKQVSDTVWHCDVNDAAGLEMCLLNGPPIDCVYFASTLTTKTVSTDEYRVADDQLRHEIQLLRLAKLLQRTTHRNGFVDWYIFTLENCAIGAGMAGLAFSMAQGDHRFLVRNLEVAHEDLQNADRHEQLLKAILAEGSSDRGEVIKLKGGRRYERHFVKFDWGRLRGEQGLRRGGVYVILGGSGAIGMVLTRYLIAQYEASVVWIGRTPEASLELQKKLAVFGGPSRPSYVQADVTQFASVAQAVAKIKRQHPVITGAMFCGMVFQFGNTVSNTTEEEFLEIAEVKTKGSVNFYAAFREVPLEFLCYFSSAQAFSFVHSRESAGYAAGTTFLDSFASALPEGRFPVGIMNWGYWQASGKELVERFGGRFGFVSDEDGCRLFDGFTDLLKRKAMHQVVCLKASPLMKTLMRCDEELVVTLGEDAESMMQAVVASE